jgi:hypothetical protein
MVFIMPDGEYIIVDWKRSKKIRKEPFKGKKGTGIFLHLDDCNFIHYSLQLNTYRHFLELHYGKRVKEMHIAVFHPNNDNYLQFPVERMEKEVQDLWDILPIMPHGG